MHDIFHKGIGVSVLCMANFEYFNRILASNLPCHLNYLGLQVN